MKTNELIKMNMDKAETGCCPRFNPEGWDGAEFTFENKPFVKAKTLSLFHFPLNMGPVFTRVCKNISQAGAELEDSYLILTYDPSAWRSEHFFAVSKNVDNEEMAALSGKYISKVFEGPYKDAPNWMKKMEEFVKNKGKTVKKQYLFYTTCPKCAKNHGKNYVVCFAEIK